MLFVVFAIPLPSKVAAVAFADASVAVVSSPVVAVGGSLDLGGQSIIGMILRLIGT